MKLFCCLLPFFLSLLCLLWPIAMCNNHNAPAAVDEANLEKKVAAKPTIFTNPTFDKEKTAKILNDAMCEKSVFQFWKSENWKKDLMVMELVKYTNEQRQQALTVLKEKYKKDLCGILIGSRWIHTGSKLLLEALVMEPAEYDIRQLRIALFPDPTSYILSEILNTRSNEQIKKFLKAPALSEFNYYISRFHEYFQIIYKYLTSAERDESTKTDPIKAKKVAQQLLESRYNFDRKKFIELWIKQNPSQMSLVAKKYDELTKIKNAIYSDMKTMFKDGSDDKLYKALMAPLWIFDYKPWFFATRIEQAMEHIRLIVTRSEIDLADIRDYCDKEYYSRKTLVDIIKSKASRDLKDGLIALVNGNMHSSKIEGSNGKHHNHN